MVEPKSVQDKLDRYAGDKICQEPSLDVVEGDDFSVRYEEALLIFISAREVNKNVEQHNYVIHDIDMIQVHGAISIKCNPEWNCDRLYGSEKHQKQIPSLHVYRIWIYHQEWDFRLCFLTLDFMELFC